MTTTRRPRGKAKGKGKGKDAPDLAGSGPIGSVDALYAIEHAGDRRRATARLRRALVDAEPGPLTLQVVFALVRLADAQSARPLGALTERLHGSPRAIVESCALLAQNDVAALLARCAADPLVSRFSPIACCHAPRPLPDGARLFSLYIEELRRAASLQGASAYRAFLGDVAEAAFRQIACGASPDQLLGDAGCGFFVDAITAELPGTTDFLAARGMVWLLGVLEPADDTARSAIERARTRFRNADFAEECRRILAGEPWPPLPHPTVPPERAS